MNSPTLIGDGAVAYLLAAVKARWLRVGLLGVYVVATRYLGHFAMKGLAAAYGYIARSVLPNMIGARGDSGYDWGCPAAEGRRANRPR